MSTADVGERALGASRARADCAVITADVVHSELARMVEPDSCGARRESRDPWAEFLKCLELYSSEVLTRAELLTLCGDVLCGAMGGARGK
jgi:hypothetical protein